MSGRVQARLHIRAAVAAVLLFAGTTLPAKAEWPLIDPSEQPGPLTREAFASPYGRALVAEFVTQIRAAADPACLQSKNLNAEQIAQRGEKLLTTWGVRTMEQLASFIDITIYETTLAKSAGLKANAEIQSLRKHPDVKRYLGLQRPLRLARLLDHVVEQFDRYAILFRIKIAPVSPITTGNADLLRADPTEQAESALAAFVEANKSPEVRRYRELSAEVSAAMTAAIDANYVRYMNFGTIYPEMGKELAVLCVGQPN